MIFDRSRVQKMDACDGPAGPTPGAHNESYEAFEGDEPPHPLASFLKLTRALRTADRQLEALALAELAGIGLRIEVDRSLRKGSQPAPPRILRTGLSLRRAARKDVTERKKTGPAEREFDRARNGAVGGVTAPRLLDRPTLTRSDPRG